MLKTQSVGCFVLSTTRCPGGMLGGGGGFSLQIPAEIPGFYFGVRGSPSWVQARAGKSDVDLPHKTTRVLNRIYF